MSIQKEKLTQRIESCMNLALLGHTFINKILQKDKTCFDCMTPKQAQTMFDNLVHEKCRMKLSKVMFLNWEELPDGCNTNDQQYIEFAHVAKHDHHRETIVDQTLERLYRLANPTLTNITQIPQRIMELAKQWMPQKNKNHD